MPDGVRECQELVTLRLMLEQYEKQGSYSQAEALRFAINIIDRPIPKSSECMVNHSLYRKDGDKRFYCRNCDKVFVLDNDQIVELEQDKPKSGTVGEIDLEKLPIKLPNCKELCVIREKHGWWVGYEGKTLKDEVSASAKTLNEAIDKLVKYFPKFFDKQSLAPLLGDKPIDSVPMSFTEEEIKQIKGTPRVVKVPDKKCYDTLADLPRGMTHWSGAAKQKHWEHKGWNDAVDEFKKINEVSDGKS